MVVNPDYVCVDWGTSRLGATLCEATDDGYIGHGVLWGPGIKQARYSVEQVLFETISPWIREYGRLPILLAGMVGSNIGWRMMPYLPCPIRVDDICAQCATFEARGHDVVIVPGLECTNSFGEPDTMRGEELQALGWLHAEPSRRHGSYLVCLPGTHTKWARIEDGCMVSFQTAMTGELYALMRDHSVLLAQNGQAASATENGGDAFLEGVDACRRARGVLSHAIFSARSRLLRHKLEADAAASYLSGMLIAADVSGALELLEPSVGEIHLVGDPTLCERFATTLGVFGLPGRIMDGSVAATQGFSVLYRELFEAVPDRSVSA